MKAKNLFNKAMQYGGLTINSKSMPVTYKRGYQVSVRDCYKLRVENAQKIVNAIDSVLARIKKGQFCGLWIDEGYIYIDISVRIADRLDAVIIGERLNQKSIYDWKNDNCIML